MFRKNELIFRNYEFVFRKNELTDGEVSVENVTLGAPF
jgi:hypothetical protein